MKLTTYKGLVYPAQCDAMGHMNTQHYTAAFDVSFWHLLRECGYSSSWIKERGEGWVDVRHELSFMKEVRAGELFRIDSVVENVGTTSLTSRHTLSELDGDKDCADIVIVSVYFDLESRQKKAIPDDIRRGAAYYIRQAIS